MIKEIERAKVGYEKVVEVFDDLIANIEEAKAEEMAVIEQKYAERLDKYNADRANYVETDFIEVPDEVEAETEEDSLDELAEVGETTNQFQTTV